MPPADDTASTKHITLAEQESHPNFSGILKQGILSLGAVKGAPGSFSSRQGGSCRVDRIRVFGCRIAKNSSRSGAQLPQSRAKL